MPNLNVFITSLKTLWIKRAKLTQQSWNTILQNENPDFNLIYKVGPLIAKKLKDNCKNPFWRDVFSAFLEFSLKVTPQTQSQFLSSSFLYNNNITIGENAITFNHLIKKNICNISCLKIQDNFRDYNNFKETFPEVRINVVTYNGIVQSVARYERKLNLKNGSDETGLQPHIQIITAQTKGTKALKMILTPHVNIIRGLNTWKNNLGIDIDRTKVFKTLLKTTNDTTLRWFQFRITHNILTTNRSVAKYNTNQDENCSFCGLYPESVEHLLWGCRFVRTFWNDLTITLNNKCSHAHNLRLNKQLIILGYDDNIKTDRVLDLIIIMAKYFIYVSKVKRTKPNIDIFNHVLKTRYRIEKQTNLKQMQANKFDTQWKPYSLMLS